MRLRRPIAALALPLVLVAGLAACGSDDEGSSDATTPGGSSGGDASLTVYSGRNEDLVAPLIAQFTEETGIEVEVRYGTSAEMGAQLFEEGESTPADVFLSQEVGAIGVLEMEGLLHALPDETIAKVGEKYRPGDSNAWVGVTGRSRVIVVNPEALGDAPMPEGVLDLTDPAYEGQVAWAPSNASFQSFITAFRVAEGEDAAREWLEAMIDNGAATYESNVEILDAVNEGEVALGLINHYYWARAYAELGEEQASELIFPKGDDPGGLVNATAVAITNNGADNPGSQAFVDYLLSEAGQSYFVEETFEYPLVEGMGEPEGVPPLAELEGPTLNLTDLESLEETLALLTDLGLLS